MDFVVFATWLAGTVLPALADRVRLDLVPIEHYQRLPHLVGDHSARMAKPKRSPSETSNRVENKRSRTDVIGGMEE